ncbi:hypothetical protein PRK78_005243 [Emydomyces testavorans]|uniref:Uncharacterized protein n=1 Tax=Emydomyces testavorans TaxID=2070801 RepID=A0AAF0DJX1_9EURO|nr:hypothetical protein PRK78_005243 [Emydomyces testavorans]
MPLPAPRSLLTPYPEPLPLYTPRRSGPHESETASIHSTAPSYVSAAPSYHSNPPSHHIRASDIALGPENNWSTRENNSSAPSSSLNSSRQTGLPSAQRYAPGFETRGGDLSYSSIRSLYSISEWVPVTGGLQARHYHNVAKMRVTDASRSIFPALMPIASESAPGSRCENGSVSDGIARRFTAPTLNTGGPSVFGENHNSSSSSLVHNSMQDPVVHPRSHSPQPSAGSSTSLENHLWHHSAEHLPFSPLEDPDLVGEAAAARFRSQRIYRTLQQEENLNQQSQRSGANPRQQEPRQSGHIYQYSSLITEADNPRMHPRRSTESDLSFEPSHADEEPGPSDQRTNATATAITRQCSNTPVDYDEVLRAQESRNWDFMLAQMADWEERQRSWKKFKDEVDRRLNSGIKIGMGWGVWSSVGAKRKLKKKQFGSHPGLKKWKNKVGLAH